MIYLWRCTGCNFHVDVERPVAKCTEAPDADTKCSCEVPTWQRVYQAPMQMTASYPDGVRRFTEMREVAKLQREAAVSRDGRKAEIAREIRKIRGGGKSNDK